MWKKVATLMLPILNKIKNYNVQKNKVETLMLPIFSQLFYSLEWFWTENDFLEFYI